MSAIYVNCWKIKVKMELPKIIGWDVDLKCLRPEGLKWGHCTACGWMVATNATAM